MSPQRDGVDQEVRSLELPLADVSEQTPVTFGRAPDNTILLRHVSVARRHGRLYTQGAQLVVMDHLSANGIEVQYGGAVSRCDALWLTALPLTRPIILYIGQLHLTITQRADHLIFTYPG